MGSRAAGADGLCEGNADNFLSRDFDGGRLCSGGLDYRQHGAVDAQHGTGGRDACGEGSERGRTDDERHDDVQLSRHIRSGFRVSDLYRASEHDDRSHLTAGQYRSLMADPEKYTIPVPLTYDEIEFIILDLQQCQREDKLDRSAMINKLRSYLKPAHDA